MYQPDLDLTRDAIASSTLSHGLMLLGDPWTSAVLLGAFTGIHQFEVWHERLEIPRATLTDRLGKLITLGLMRQRGYGQRPVRMGYRLTQAGLKLYNHVLMFWVWERRWGQRQALLPERLVHRPCGQPFLPVLACATCQHETGLNDLTLTLEVNPELLARAGPAGRNARVTGIEPSRMGLRVDRWVLLIVNAVFLGCHHFDQLCHVLGISTSVLSRRLAAMEANGLLVCESDRADNRRTRYRLTPASRDLFAYLVCFSHWAAVHHLQQPSSVRPVHKACGHAFAPQVQCSACAAPVHPWDVDFAPAPPVSHLPPHQREKELTCP